MPKGLREPLADRFWRFVEKSDDCWIWVGAHQASGYGRIKDNGEMLLAHRASYQLHFGTIAQGLWVLHRCDNPSCVNPAHLYLGDRAQNMKDAHERGRIDMKKVAAARRPRAQR